MKRKPFVVFATYSKWFKVLSDLFIPLSLLAFMAIGTGASVTLVLSGYAVYVTLWLVTLVIESSYRVIDSSFGKIKCRDGKHPRQASFDSSQTKIGVGAFHSIYRLMCRFLSKLSQNCCRNCGSVAF